MVSFAERSTTTYIGNVVIYVVGSYFPIDVQAGDVLFLAARPPFARDEKPRFEHVALAYESRTVNNASELGDLRVIALPESADEAVPGIYPTTGKKYWFDYVQRARLGCPLGIWNLIARENNLTRREAEHWGRLLSLRTGSVRFSYTSDFVVDSSFSNPFSSNCLGFVCSFYDHYGIRFFGDIYPEYENQHQSPSNTPIRRFPSPGHLAFVMDDSTVARPYTPSNRAEAECRARADSTLEQYLDN